MKKVKIPKYVAKDAKLGIKLMERGFKGGTETGWNRAYQLAEDDKISVEDLAVMRAWYARHGPDAKNGGTSYPGYCKWIEDGKPFDEGFNDYRGAVSWLIWGGDAAYRWLKTNKIRDVLLEHFPEGKEASEKNNLSC